MSDSKQDKRLIVLRGVPGAGKTQVCLELRKRLGQASIRLNLDDFAPPTEKPQFEAAIANSLGYRYVIAELYSGLEHTSDPLFWVSKFTPDYRVHLFMLHLSPEKGFENCADLRHGSSRFASLAGYRYQVYDRFYSDPKFTCFASKIGVEEIKLDSEDGGWVRLAAEVLGQVGSNPLRHGQKRALSKLRGVSRCPLSGDAHAANSTGRCGRGRETRKQD